MRAMRAREILRDQYAFGILRFYSMPERTATETLYIPKCS